MIIRTITGDIKPEKLGRTNYHEHAFQVSPLLPGDELTSKEKSGNEFLRLAKSGFDSYVDATPIGLGRRPDLIAEIASRSGLQVVHATGVHKSAHYAKEQKITQLKVEELASLFEYELQNGILIDDSTLLINEANTSEIKAGFIKFGISDAPLTTFENRALQASAIVSAKTGVAIMIHTDSASDIFTTLDLLEEAGANLARVVVAHIDRRPDSQFHAEIAARGAYLGYDGAGRTKYFADEVLVKLFADLVELGFGANVLFGGDVARSSRYIEYGGAPGLEYLGNTFLPMVRERTSAEIVEKTLTTNPANWLAFNP